jgi:hypothetical protein
MNSKHGRWGISGECLPAYWDQKRLESLGFFCQGGFLDEDDMRTFQIFNIKDNSFSFELLENEYEMFIIKEIRKQKLNKIINSCFKNRHYE